MRGRRFLVMLTTLAAAVAIGGLTASPSLASTTAPAWAGPASVTVGGAVSAPAAYTPAQLAALPRTSMPLSRRPGGTVTGVSLLALVNDSAPELPDAKNAELRVAITVSGPGHQAVTFAMGELDPAFGAHDALLVPSRATSTLVVPGDRDSSRTVIAVDDIQVSVAADSPSDVAAGSLVVHAGSRTLTLTAAQLAQLPAETRTVTFQAGTAPQTHTEQGPDLLLVLLRAGVLPTRTTAVVGVGSDGYLATVTPFEELTGGRPLMISTVEDGVALAQPRLVVDGDVKGGRYVSDLTDLAVTRY